MPLCQGHSPITINRYYNEWIRKKLHKYLNLKLVKNQFLKDNIPSKLQFCGILLLLL